MNADERDPQDAMPEDEPTIIIDDDAVVVDGDSDGYEVRPRKVEPEVAPGMPSDEVVMADVEDEEDAMVVLLDEDDLAEGEGLMTTMPGAEPLPAAAMPQSMDPASEAVAMAASDAHAYGGEPLPEIEHVEDITAYLEEESYELEAPIEPMPYVPEEEPSGSAGRKVLVLMSVIALAGAGAFFGPPLWNQYMVESNPEVAHANTRTDVPAAVDDVAPNENPQPATDTVATKDSVPNASGDSVSPEFVDWMRATMSSNLEMAIAKSETRNP